MLEPVDGMIQKARRAALDEFNANVKALEEQGKSYSGSVEAELENYINGPLKNVFVEARKSNARLFLVWRWSGWLALAVQVFILLKALALIYARLAFNPQVGNQDLAAHIGGGNPGTAITTVERLTTVQEEKTGIHHGFRLPTPKVLYLFHCRGLGRVDKRDSPGAVIVIQAGICNGDQRGTKPDVERRVGVL
ncbi:hypothetical protein ACNKFW_07570 [Paracoccus sp. TD-10]|uniref:hypothetical protein n=1 Tax=Paracoccus sp. TD-10 TaxID=3395918 RepID=UPI003AABCC1F